MRLGLGRSRSRWSRDRLRCTGGCNRFGIPGQRARDLGLNPDRRFGRLHLRRVQGTIGAGGSRFACGLSRLGDHRAPIACVERTTVEQRDCPQAESGGSQA
jgi:hypothetical protein